MSTCVMFLCDQSNKQFETPIQSCLSHLNVLGSGSGRTLRSVLPVKNRLPILIQLDSGNYDVAWVDTNGRRRTIRFVTLDTVYVDDPFFPVYLCDLTLPALVLPADDQDFIIFANG